MRLEWLEDLLAVLETDSLNAAAERRFLTQPAFSRRLQTIEQMVGVPLVDRACKPARPLPVLLRQRDRIRELTLDLRDLAYEMKRGDALERIVIASQHAIMTTLAPELVKRVSAQVPGGILLRSGNYDECQSLLLSRQAQMTLTYRSTDMRAELRRDYLEELVLGNERLIPVIARESLPKLRVALQAGELPVVAYPADVFLGQVFARELQPRLPDSPFVHRQAETALTLAALQMAVAGIGVAWVPYALAARDVKDGTLKDLRESLPDCGLEIVAARQAHAPTAAESAVWEALRTLQSPAGPAPQQS
ncbi:MAG: hypothetical protein OJF60_003549 [Burkholderiaceae bacterium]|nr:MAG: hypothetical protein OJF60_003549 [Burkholderiaceae bacterium]